MLRMTTIKVETSACDGVRALAEHQGVTMVSRVSRVSRSVG